MDAKFKAGDVLVRTAYKNLKTAYGRDEQTVVSVVSDEHPICPQIWYILRDSRGKLGTGLKCIMEECFEIKEA